MTAQWLAEIDTMRTRMRGVRDALAAAGTAGRIDLTPLAGQNGLFAMLPVTKDEVAALREEYAIYMAASGRVNIAGLTHANLPKFIAALAAVTG
jgi:aromatic-amino-acid transaminase